MIVSYFYTYLEITIWIHSAVSHQLLLNEFFSIPTGYTNVCKCIATHEGYSQRSLLKQLDYILLDSVLHICRWPRCQRICTCRSHQSVAMLLGRSCLCLEKTLTQQLQATGGGGGGTPRIVLLTGAKMSRVPDQLRATVWAFRISLSIIKFTLKKNIIYIYNIYRH